VWVCLCSNMRGIDAFHLNCVVTRCILFRLVLSLILVCNVVSRRSALLRGCHLLALRCALVWLVLLVLACSDFSLLCVLLAMFFFLSREFIFSGDGQRELVPTTAAGLSRFPWPLNAGGANLAPHPSQPMRVAFSAKRLQSLLVEAQCLGRFVDHRWTT